MLPKAHALNNFLLILKFNILLILNWTQALFYQKEDKSMCPVGREKTEIEQEL